MVHGLKHHFLKILAWETVLQQTGRCERMTDHGVYLVESQPVFHLVLVSLADGPNKAEEEIHRFSAVPASVFQRQVNRHFIVAHGHQRFNPVFPALVKYPVVKFQSSLVGLLLISHRKNPRPSDRHAKTFESHASQQSDILFIVVIEIHPPALGVVDHILRLQRPLYIFQGHMVLQVVVPQILIKMLSHTVLHGDSLSVLPVTALQLVGGCGSSPEKILRKCPGCHRLIPPFQSR